MTTLAYADATALAARIAASPTPRLVAFDCDGVLAPIVDHADDARLLDGIHPLLHRLASDPATTVAVVSGRSLDGLRQFGFGDDIVVIGSHGAERRDGEEPALTTVELERLDALERIVIDAQRLAGDGAWVERKPTSVAVHVRRADPTAGARALAMAESLGTEIDGAVAVPGTQVVELLARRTDKGTALNALRREFGAASTTYIGDDVTDEHALRLVTGEHDTGIKIGDAPTAARFRLAGPETVRDLLEVLTATIE